RETPPPSNGRCKGKGSDELSITINPVPVGLCILAGVVGWAVEAMLLKLQQRLDPLIVCGAQVVAAVEPQKVVVKRSGVGVVVRGGADFAKHLSAVRGTGEQSIGIKSVRGCCGVLATFPYNSCGNRL